MANPHLPMPSHYMAPSVVGAPHKFQEKTGSFLPLVAPFYVSFCFACSPLLYNYAAELMLALRILVHVFHHFLNMFFKYISIMNFQIYSNCL